jgi:uncharacterized protein (TIGR00369 family)
MEFPVHNPFVQALGFELLRFAAGEAELRLEPQALHLNSFQVVHGGVSMTLLDVVMAHAARSLHLDQAGGGPGVVTVEMKTAFMRPAEGVLRATGRVLHASSTMAFTEGSVWLADGKLCAHATGTFKYVRKLPVSGRRVQALHRKLEGNGSD